MYYIIEIQTNGDTGAHIVTTRNDRYSAEAEYHRVLSAAAVSTVQKHACTLLNDEGKELMHQVYIHEQETPGEGE